MHSSVAACIVVRVVEIEDFKSRFLSPEKVCFFCCNELTYLYCEKNGLNAIRLDEKVLQPEYTQINHWAYATLFELISRYPQDSNEQALLERHFWDIKCLFIQVVKYIRCLEYFFSQIQVDDVFISDEPTLRLLTLVCQDYFEEKKKIRVFSSPLPAAPIRRRIPFKTLFYKVLSFFSNLLTLGIYFKSFLQKKPIFAASGSLNHLQRLTDHFQQSGKFNVIFCENQFNLSKALYCFRRGMGFLIFKAPGHITNPFRGLVWPPGAGIKYRGQSLTRLLNHVFRELAFFDFKSHGFKTADVECFLNKKAIAGVLLDEDFSIRRVWAITCRKLKIPCFVLSHGIPIVPVKFPEQDPYAGAYYSATTFIHSDYEKKAYEEIFYRGDRLVVSGTPRYDRINEILNRAPAVPDNPDPEPSKVLFCAATMIRYDFAQLSAAWDVMGSHTLSRKYTIGYVRDLLRFLKEHSRTKLQIKPHYCDGEAWKLFLNEIAADPAAYELRAYNDDMLGLLMQADLVITTPSTVISEALMLNKDVLLLNYDGCDSLAREYVEREVVLLATSPAELQERLREYFTSPLCSKNLAAAREKSQSYFSRFKDGQNTARAAVCIETAVLEGERMTRVRE